MLYVAIVWAVIALAVLIYFVLRQTKTEITEKDVIYLPKFLFYFGVVIHLGGGALGAWALYAQPTVWAAFGIGAGLVLLGIAAMLCQLNQKTTMVTSTTFTYTTFLGNTREYRISDITGFKINNDSISVLTSDGKKIHIESIAIKDEHFLTLVDEHLGGGEDDDT